MPDKHATNSNKTRELVTEFDRFGLRGCFDAYGTNGRSSSSEWKFEDRLGGWTRVINNPGSPLKS